MPRGKYVNHKGRSRHFTSPEELAQESSEEETSSEEDTEGNDGEADGAAGPSTSKTKAKKKTQKKAEASSEEDSDEESSEDDRDARKGVASLIEIENPNRAVKKTTKKVAQITLDDVKKEAIKPELSRREREQIEKQKERLRYEKMHAAGKTDEARADLARLAIIRQQRADAAAKREAEKKALDEKKSTTKA